MATARASVAAIRPWQLDQPREQLHRPSWVELMSFFSSICRSLRPCLVAANIFLHTKWPPKITDYRDTAALRKDIRCPSCCQRQNCCHLKKENTSTWSVVALLFLLEACQRNFIGWLTSQRKASTSPSSFINLSIPPLKCQAQPCLYMLAWISLLQFAF